MIEMLLMVCFSFSAVFLRSEQTFSDADVLSILNENGSSWLGLADLILEDFECGILCIRMKVLGFTEECKRSERDFLSESGNIYESGKIFPSLNLALKELYIKDQRKNQSHSNFRPLLARKSAPYMILSF